MVTMPRISAGLLMFRVRDGTLQVFLAHPGGPFHARKDDGAWTIPKGEPDAGEDLLDAARREFQEETGMVPTGPFIPLTPVKQRGGKVVHAWAFEGDCDGKEVVSNTFTTEWPPGSGRQAEFPEIDRAEFFDVPKGKRKAKAAQDALIEELEQVLARRAS
jgi:predicted NUDIX family NTP pyrophosphohydrolase